MLGTRLFLVRGLDNHSPLSSCHHPELGCNVLQQHTHFFLILKEEYFRQHVLCSATHTAREFRIQRLLQGFSQSYPTASF